MKMQINVLHVIAIITDWNNLMETVLDNAFVKRVIMMIIEIVLVNNVPHFGN